MPRRKESRRRNRDPAPEPDLAPIESPSVPARRRPPIWINVRLGEHVAGGGMNHFNRRRSITTGVRVRMLCRRPAVM